MLRFGFQQDDYACFLVLTSRIWFGMASGIALCHRVLGHVVGFWVSNSKLMQVGSRSKFEFDGESKHILIGNNLELEFCIYEFFLSRAFTRKRPDLHP